MKRPITDSNRDQDKTPSAQLHDGNTIKQLYNAMCLTGPSEYRPRAAAQARFAMESKQRAGTRI
jgi:hypothetical protein